VNRTFTPANFVMAQAALFVLLALTILLDDTTASAGDPKAEPSASVTKQLRKLKQRVAVLESRSAQPGPQGAQGQQGIQGLAGTAPACQGNGSGDVMVAAGAVCIDKYEASIWSTPTGGTQFGATSDNFPAGCLDTGFGCKGKIFARSVVGVTPSRFVTYFQAQQALANSGKRLPSNAEWQQAAIGTPEGQCNTGDGVARATGLFDNCVSDWGAFDMAGNLAEWVGDWVPASPNSCIGWGSVGTFSSDDKMCLTGASTTTTGPGALVRGGAYVEGTPAGPFAVWGFVRPQQSGEDTGFRGAR
jgi:hypothetical protein